MFKRPEPEDGFPLCFLLNLLWGLGWGIAAAVLLVLHLRMGLPSILWRGALALWLVTALARTKLIEWGSVASSEKDAPRPNKNPYSAKTEVGGAAVEAASEDTEMQSIRQQQEERTAETAAEETHAGIEATLHELNRRMEEENAVLRLEVTPKEERSDEQQPLQLGG